LGLTLEGLKAGFFVSGWRLEKGEENCEFGKDEFADAIAGFVRGWFVLFVIIILL